VSFLGFLTYVFVTVTARLPLAQLGLGIGLAGALMQGKRPWMPAYLRWFLALLVWGLCSSLWSLYPEMSSKVIWQFFKVWLFMFVGANAVRSPRQLQIFLAVMLLFFLAYPARGIALNYARGILEGGRVSLGSGVLVNPNYYAAGALTPIAICGALFLRSTDKRLRIALAAAAALLVITVVITQSRGGIIALFCFIALTIARSRRRGQAIAAVAILGALVALTAPDEAWERLGGLGKIRGRGGVAAADPEGSAATRYEILLNAIDIADDHLVFGTGIGTYKAVNRQYRPDLGWIDTHNTYLNVQVETGLVGLALFLGMIVSVFRFAKQRSVPPASPATAQAIRLFGAGLLGFLVASIFGTFPYFQFLHFHLLTFTLMAKIWPAEDALTPRPPAPLADGEPA
jgi:O-antigen ligase